MHSSYTSPNLDKDRMRNGSDAEPLSEGLGSRCMYGSPFRDINHGSIRMEPSY